MHLLFSWFPWVETPVHFPLIVFYVAVGHKGRERLQAEFGFASERLRVLLNWVDIEKFKPR